MLRNGLQATALCEHGTGVVFNHSLVRGKTDFYKEGAELLSRHALKREIFCRIESFHRLALDHDVLSAVILQKLGQVSFVVFELSCQHLC